MQSWVSKRRKDRLPSRIPSLESVAWSHHVWILGLIEVQARDWAQLFLCPRYRILAILKLWAPQALCSKIFLRWSLSVKSLSRQIWRGNRTPAPRYGSNFHQERPPMTADRSPLLRIWVLLLGRMSTLGPECQSWEEKKDEGPNVPGIQLWHWSKSGS